MEAAGAGRAGRRNVHTAQWQPIVGTPTLVPEPSTVIRMESSNPLCAGLPFLRFAVRDGFRLGARLSQSSFSMACTKRNRSSVSAFSTRRCSSSVTLPRVFSCSMASRSMLWRAMRKSGCWMVFFLAEMKHPEVHLGLRFSERTKNSNVAGGRGYSCSLILTSFYLGKPLILHPSKILIGPARPFRLLSKCKTCPVGGLLVGFQQ